MRRKLRVPQRDQMEIRIESIDQLLPSDDPARAIWQYVEALDLSAWLANIRSTPGQRGAPAIDPRLLLALWLQATCDGIASAREISTLCAQHLAYRWLCGDKPVNHHTLSDFRSSAPAAMENLLTQSAATLLHAGLADLTRVAQDGVRVRASAGTSSFRRELTLQECLLEAKTQVEALRGRDDDKDDDKDADKDSEDSSSSGPTSKGSQAAQRRVAEDLQRRLQSALANLETLRQTNAERRSDKRKDPAELRVSTTDPEARKMKMADGGFRPAYNVQFATTTTGGAVVGVAVTQEGCDNNQLVPMIERLERTLGQRPQEMLVDGGFVDREQIEQAEMDWGVKVYAPVKEEARYQEKKQDPFARRPHDSDGTAQWRARMGTAEGRAAYRWRCRTAEWVNARARNRGLRQFLVRGLQKVFSTACLYALAHNLTQSLTLSGGVTT
jgi:transposase